MKKICKEYKTNYIKNMNQKDKEFVRSVINYSINNKDDKCNKTLIILLYNYFNNISKLPIVDYITGPFTLSYHYIPSLNKKIYIFGEYHPFKNPCTNNYMNIYDYFEKLFLNTGVFIDFYIEVFPNIMTMSDYDKYKYKYFCDINKSNLDTYLKKNGILNYLRNKFSKCLYHKKNNLCQSIRSHYIDMRPQQYDTEYISELNHILKTMGPLISPIDSRVEEYKTDDYDILVDYFNNLFPLSSVENRRILKNVIKSLLGININKYVLQEILKHPRIKKEIEKVDLYIRIKILQFFGSEINIIISVRHMLESIVRNIDNNHSMLIDYDDDICGKHINIIYLMVLLRNIKLLYADIYTITRLFIKFNTNRENKKQRSKLNAPSSQNNIIIYTGDAHSENYRNFFKSLGEFSYNYLYTTRRNDKVSISNCLDMRNVPQPFFQDYNYRTVVNKTEFNLI